MLRYLAHRILLVAFTFLPFFVSPGSPSQGRHWISIGPGGGGALFSPAVSPHNPNRILVACDMTGSYISDDGGLSWRTFNLRGQVHFFVFDPQDDNVIYAASLGLWRSSDGGRTWHLIFPDPRKVRSVSMADDHASERLLTTHPTAPVTALVVDPVNSKTLYATMSDHEHTALYRSKNTGKTWIRVQILPGKVNSLYIDPQSREETRTVYMVAEDSIYKLVDGKVAKGSPPPGVSKFTGASLGFQPKTAAPIIYVSSQVSIFVSEDGGTDWRKSQFPGNETKVRAIATAAK